MSDYKGIKGFQVQTRTTDPTPYAQALADNPYGGVWSSGGAMGTARYTHGGTGTLPAGLAFGGDPSDIANCETYNGTSWSEVNNLNTGRNGLL